MKPYNEQIKDGRKASGLTQKEAAEKAGISLRYYQSIEAGQYWPTHEVLLKIAETLGKSIVIGAN